MECITCKVDKVRIDSGRKTKSGRVVYTGENNKGVWNGAQCTQCKSKLNSKKMIVKAEKLRFCRMCKATLDASRYFNCIDCMEYLPEDDGDLIYFTDSEIL